MMTMEGIFLHTFEEAWQRPAKYIKVDLQIIGSPSQCPNVIPRIDLTMTTSNEWHDILQAALSDARSSITCCQGDSNSKVTISVEDGVMTINFLWMKYPITVSGPALNGTVAFKAIRDRLQVVEQQAIPKNITSITSITEMRAYLSPDTTIMAKFRSPFEFAINLHLSDLDKWARLAQGEGESAPATIISYIQRGDCETSFIYNGDISSTGSVMVQTGYRAFHECQIKNASTVLPALYLRLSIANDIYAKRRKRNTQ